MFNRFSKIHYWIAIYALFMVAPYMFYYSYMYNELEVTKDLINGKSIKCNNHEYKLDNNHFLMVFYDEGGRNGKSIAIFEKQSENSAGGIELRRCERLPESPVRDIYVSVVKEYPLRKTPNDN